MIEKVVTGMIDLDTGREVDWPLPEQADEGAPARYAWINDRDPQAWPWIRQRGIDAVVAERGLTGVDLVLTLLESNDWQTLTPEGLREKLRSWPAPQTRHSANFHQVPGTYAIRTREGSLGLSATLPNAVTVKLVGLDLYPAKGKPWWLPDGQECLAPLLDGSDPTFGACTRHGDHTVVFAFAITGFKSGTGSEVRIASPESALWAGRQFKSGVVQPEIKALALNVPTNATVAHLRLTFDSDERLRLEYETATNTSARFDPNRLPAGEAGVAFRNVSLRSGFPTQPTATVLGAQWPPKRAESVAPGSTNATSLPASGSGPAVEKECRWIGASNPHSADPVRSGVSHGG